MERLKFFDEFVDPATDNSGMEFNYESLNGVVTYLFYGNEHDEPYTLKVRPAQNYLQLIFPDGKIVQSYLSDLRRVEDELEGVENGKVLDWIHSQTQDCFYVYDNMKRSV